MQEDRLEYRPYSQQSNSSYAGANPLNEVQKMSTTQLDALINRVPSNVIKNVKPQQKNLEIKFIILKKGQSIKTKQGSVMTPLLIADATGSMQLNVFDEYGTLLKESDVCYTHNAYSALYKDRLVLYQGKQGILKQLKDYFFDFVPKPNFSDKTWVSEPQTPNAQ